MSGRWFGVLGGGGLHRSRIRPSNGPLTRRVSESCLAGYLCLWMMAVWLHVGQTDNVAAREDGGHQPALRLGTTPVTQAWAKLHIFQSLYFIHFLLVQLWVGSFLSSLQICCTEPEQARWMKSWCKTTENFVNINGPSGCYALCPLRGPKATGNLSFPKGYNRMGRQLVLLVEHEQAALWQDGHQQPAWVRETRLTRIKMRI